MADTTTTPEGQVPEAVDPTPSPEAVTEPTSPEAQEPQEDVFDKDRALATIHKMREREKQAAKDRKELEQLRAERKAIEDEKLSEKERLSKRSAELEAELAKEKAARQQEINRHSVERQAGKLGIVDPEAAVKLLDWDALSYDDNGRPQDIEDALKSLLEAKPYLAAPQQRQPTSIGNPATRSSDPKERLYSPEELTAMLKDPDNERRKLAEHAIKAGHVRGTR